MQRYFENDEIFLFHGTKEENIKRIINDGFQLEKAGVGLLYGQGVYLSDSCQKADQYCDTTYRRRKEDLAMLVVRTALGRVGLFDSSKTFDFLSKSFDTIIAGQGKRFCEIVKYDVTQLYPAYVIIYSRSYGAENGRSASV